MLKSKSSWIILASLMLTFILTFSLQVAQAQEPEESYTIFLPVVIRGEGITSPPPPPPLPATISAFFANTQYKTSNANIQVDAQGGMHLAYYYYEPINNGAPTSGVYLYCSSQCDKVTSWTSVNLGEQVNEIQLHLTPAGQPRVIFRAASQSRPNGNDYFYATCDQSCTDPAQWTVIYLTSSSGLGVIDLGKDDGLPQRYFALDPQGRPRFVYNDGVTDHLGTFYAFCDDQCTDPASWFETRINKDNGNQGPYRYEKFSYPALAFTPNGQPRIMADGVSLQDEFYIYYLACDGGCDTQGSWYSVPLAERGSGVNVSYDIALDPQGRPRVAFYQGALLQGQGDRLFYAWCNDGCDGDANWQANDLGLTQGDGQGPDLELDAAGRPRIAYGLYHAGGLGYSWCDTNCEAPGAAWQHQVVESRADLLAAWSVAYPPHCEGGLWDGLTPSLALDGAGKPRIAYDATYNARCIYVPETGEWKPWHQFHLVWRTVRVTLFP